jgi:hypothetical protein
MRCFASFSLSLVVEGAKQKKPPADPARTILYTVLDPGSVCLLSQIGDQWLELRSRCEVWSDECDSVIELIKPIKKHRDPPFEIYVLAHDPLPQFPEAAKQLFDGMPAKDLRNLDSSGH